MESCAHKVNLRLLVTPKHAGGIELAAVSIAIKTQRSKHAFAWFSHKPDQYFAAWRVWAFRCGLGRKKKLSERLAPATDRQSQSTAWSSARSKALLDCFTSWWVGNEHQKIATATHGALLYAYIVLFERECRESPPSSVTSHNVPPGQPALTSWLMTFQRSCT